MVESDNQLFTPLTLVIALTSAPQLISLSTNESLPRSATICNGVNCFYIIAIWFKLIINLLHKILTLVTALTSAPQLISLSTNESLPRCATICNGVNCFYIIAIWFKLIINLLHKILTLVTALTSAPCLIKLSTNESLPCCIAKCNGVH